jgi:integrase
MQITDKGINATATDADQWLIESLGRGYGAFIGRIAPSGKRAFYYRYTGPDRAQVRLPIADYDSKGIGGMNVQQARAKAVEWSTLYHGDGKDNPGILDLRGHFQREAASKLAAERDAQEAAERQKREAKAAEAAALLEQQRRLTVKQVFERWAATELAPHIGGDGKRVGRKDGGLYVKEQFERRVFPALGDVAIQDVRKADMLAILDTVKAEGKLRTANTLLADLKQMFRFAAEREVIEHSPIELVSKRKVGGKDVKRNRVLSGDELAALVKQLPAAKLNKRTELGIWLILATGCRVGELTGAAWVDAKPQQKTLQATVDAHNTAQKSGGVQLGFVDLIAQTWYLPTTKNQRSHTIHLSDFAVQKFTELETLRPKDKATGIPVPWAFPDTKGTGPVCVKSFGKQLADRQRTEDKRMKNRTKAVDSLALAGGRWTAHDLRRTAATLMAQLGISTDVVNESLNHVLPGIAGVYIQDRREAEQVRAFDALGVKLAQVISGAPVPPNVVALKVA